MSLDEAIAASEHTPIPWVLLGVAVLPVIVLVYALSRSDGYGGWKTRPALNRSLKWVGVIGTFAALGTVFAAVMTTSSERREALDQAVESEMTEAYKVADTSIVSPGRFEFGGGGPYGRWPERLTGERTDHPAEVKVVTEEGAHYTYQATYLDGELRLHNEKNQPDPDTLRR